MSGVIILILNKHREHYMGKQGLFSSLQFVIGNQISLCSFYVLHQVGRILIGVLVDFDHPYVERVSFMYANSLIYAPHTRILM